MLKESKTISKFPIYLSMSNDTLNFEIMVHKLYHFKLRILSLVKIYRLFKEILFRTFCNKILVCKI